MSPEARPSKRARLSQNGSRLQTSSYTLSMNNLKHHPEFWFDDGNIVLAAQGDCFRVYRGLLATQSTVFAGMFPSSSDSVEDALDGYPVIHLTDSPHDLVHLLRVLLPTSSIRFHTGSHFVRSFNEISAVVRLAHKYCIQSVQDQAVRTLQEHYFASDFNAYLGLSKSQISIDRIHYIGAVNLARLTNTPLLLPMALYGCCYLGGLLVGGWTREDGTVEHLCMADLKRCFDARITLVQEQFLLLSCLFDAVPPEQCAEHGRCAPFLSNIQRKILREEVMMKKDVLWDWSPFMREMKGVCGACVQVLLERNRVERQRIWDSLPRIFGIVVEWWGMPNGRGGGDAI
ncbi:hypothetical protein LXA43DRAFT_1098154 [Ganoderma leucocontextum]|nr:hypothetical protein LXA43DRAFT_1098154 [Ganoderma leucocontextum]